MILKRKWLQLKDFIIDWVRTLDRGLLWAILCIIICGVVFIFSASPSVAERVVRNKDAYHFIKKQLFFLLPSIFLMLSVSMLSPKLIRRMSFWVGVVFFCLMICTLFLGSEIKGARRWINIGVTVQPSEFIKPAFAVISAWILASGCLKKDFHGCVISGLLLFCVVPILFLQKDLGMTFTVCAIWFVQLCLAGVSKKIIACFLGLGLLSPVFAYFVFPHARARIDGFINPSMSDTYQVRTSLQAFHNSGWFGRGPAEGIIKAKLPDAHTDFIFAVAAEEYGFLICTGIIFLFCFVVLRGLYIMSKEKNLFNVLAVAGLLTQIGVQAFINIASTLNMIPPKGMTLPFISYGGSSLFSIAFAFGIILSLTRRHPTQGGLE